MNKHRKNDERICINCGECFAFWVQISCWSSFVIDKKTKSMCAFFGHNIYVTQNSADVLINIIIAWCGLKSNQMIEYAQNQLENYFFPYQFCFGVK